MTASFDMRNLAFGICPVPPKGNANFASVQHFIPKVAFTTRLAFNEAEKVAELLLIREPERRFYRECRNAGFEVAVHDESIGSEQVFDVSQLRLRFTVAQAGRNPVQVRFDPWTATFKGPGWSFTWTQLMFRPEECLARAGVLAKPG